jgi:hypothetical protein
MANALSKRSELVVTRGYLSALRQIHERFGAIENCFFKRRNLRIADADDGRVVAQRRHLGFASGSLRSTTRRGAWSPSSATLALGKAMDRPAARLGSTSEMPLLTSPPTLGLWDKDFTDYVWRLERPRSLGQIHNSLAKRLKTDIAEACLQ